MNSNYDLEAIAKKAGLIIRDNNDSLLIRTKFNILNKSDFGIALFIILGILITCLTFDKSADFVSRIIGLSLGLGIATVSSFILISNLTNFIDVTDKRIIIRNKLRTNTIVNDSPITIKMKTRKDEIRLKTQPGSGSKFQIIDIIISQKNKEYHALNFQHDIKYSSKINSLGQLITHLIKDKLNKKHE